MRSIQDSPAMTSPKHRRTNKSNLKGSSIYWIIGGLVFFLFVLNISFNSAQPTFTLRTIRNTPAGMYSIVERSMIDYLLEHPQRAYFAKLFTEFGFTRGMEVGVAGGRFSEHFLIQNAKLSRWHWTMMEPFPNADLLSRYPVDEYGNYMHSAEQSPKNWKRRNIGENAQKTFIRQLSTNETVLAGFSPNSFDFIYLDGAHDYVNVKKEMFAYWPLVRPGGVLAGHDYCAYKFVPRKNCKDCQDPIPRNCVNCDDVPLCAVYTEYSSSLSGKPVKSQKGVVQAVHEFLVESIPHIPVFHTNEDFTRYSLQQDGIDYDLILTKTRNPSWFIVKPLIGENQ